MLHRVLDPTPCPSLAEYRSGGGGRAALEAQRLGATATIEHVDASGLRGRGGAGFPTGTKWRTVADAATPSAPTPIVVNAAEGEPGTFKDRTLLRRNPYRVLEGAAIAAIALDAREVIIAIKASFTHEIRRLRQAIAELDTAPFAPGLTFRLALGPDAYLFGEETALLEVIERRQPFPRVTPPYRRGLDPNEPAPQRDASHLHLAVTGGSDEPPALIDNVETLANVPGIIANGPDWFRSVGTPASPGTVVCTITGHTRRHGAGEFPMGTPLTDVIAELGGGARPDHHLVGAVSGVANPLLPATSFPTGLCYEAMADAGSALGAAGFIVFDDTSDPVAVAHGIARFLAVESCGQCEPCKADGLAIAAALDRVRTGRGTDRDLTEITSRLDTVTRGARCFLAYQQQRTVSSILQLFPESFTEHVAPDGAPELIAAVVDIVGDRAILDSEQSRKQPDWTYGSTDSGAYPAARYADTPLTIRPRPSREHPTIVAPPARLDDETAFDQIRAVHRELDALLDRLDDSADPATTRDLLAQLDQALRRHHDVTTHVVYPTLTRAVPGLGDDAAWIAEHATETAERIAQHLLSTHEDPTPARLNALRDAVDEHIVHDEHFVIPLLHGHLDPDDLRRLADAVATARAHPIPARHSTARTPLERTTP